MTIYIYGASDDLVEFEGDFREEYNTYDHGYFHIKDEQGEGVRVEAHYGENGTWLIGAAPLDEDVPMPWNIGYAFPDEVRYSNTYSAILRIDAPEGVTVTQVNKNGDPVDE